MTTKQYLIPGIGLISEEGTEEYLIPGGGLFQETTPHIRQYVIPGIGVINESGTDEYVIPGGGVINETDTPIDLTQTVSPSGIASAESFGTADFDFVLTSTGIASAEEFGTPTITAPAPTSNVVPITRIPINIPIVNEMASQVMNVAALISGELISTALVNDYSRKRLMLYASSDSASGEIYFGPEGVTPQTGMILPKAMWVELPCSDELDTYVVASGAGTELRIFELS